MKTDIIPCICSEETANDSVYSGMPQLKVTDNMEFFEIFCPACGRGGLIQYKSAYLAVKGWNKMQKRLRNEDIFNEETEI